MKTCRVARLWVAAVALEHSRDLQRPPDGDGVFVSTLRAAERELGALV